MLNESCFSYRNDCLFSENVNVFSIVAKTGTPVYVYSQAHFMQQISELQTAFQNVSSMICYSIKGCHNTHIIRFFVNNGCGTDIVSGGELYRALHSGASPKKIVYSGVGKTIREITEALQSDILMFNVESEQELERISQIASKMDKTASIALRVNPNIDAKTHPYITTGLKKNKFGIDDEFVFSLYHKAKSLSHIDPIGIDCHIGSQLLDITPLGEAMTILSNYVKELRQEGINIRYVDVGGGLGVPYKTGDAIPSAEQYAKTITAPFAEIPGITFILEPGRFLAAQGGMLITQVQYIKQNAFHKKFVIVDTGMHHIMRPPLYGALHNIIPVRKKSGQTLKIIKKSFVNKNANNIIPQENQISENQELVDIVGPICETTDFLAKDYPLESVSQGDFLAILDSGAYCSVMSSHYNSHPLPVEVFVRNNTFEIIRKREQYEDIIKEEIL